MDKKAIKKFAIESRKILIAGVKNKLAKLGITVTGVEKAIQIDSNLIEIESTKERYTGKNIIGRLKLVEELNRREKQMDNYKVAFETLVEEVAYTWFNRLIAIRFMEVNDYLPEHQRILSSEITGKKEPDIITNLLDTELYATMDMVTKDRVTALLADGSAEAVDNLYQLVFIKQCNNLNRLLPDLFEHIDDYTELLFTISYIDDNGVIARLLTISEADFDVRQKGQVEIIGWMYQYYNTEPKDKVFARGNRKIRADEIPAATQLFTPDWIVRYMVENSLGRYYIDQKLTNPAETRTEKEIAEEFGWKYYLPTANQPEDVQLQIQDERKDKSVFALQELKLIDPSMGSGHILVYAFDLLIKLYIAEGFRERDAAELIIEKNLFGLDIDKRAFQLTYFALMMKGRQYSRRILAKQIKPNVYAVPDNYGIGEAELQLLHTKFSDPEKAQQDLLKMSDSFKNGNDLGSLIELEGIDFENLKRGMDTEKLSFLDVAITEMVYIGELLQKKYHIGITNPPYMGGSGMNKVLSDFVKKNYPDSKSDLFGVFIERLQKMIVSTGYYALITQHAWMFLSSYEKLRSKINEQTIINMAHLGTRAFEEIGGEVVQTTAFIMSPKKNKNFVGSYLRLVDFTSHELKEEKTLRAITTGNADYLYHTVQDNFAKIPGQPISYWISENLIHDFVVGKRLQSIYTTRTGMTTSNNELFLRLWYEIEYEKMELNCIQEISSKAKWFPYAKGGGYCKWYGLEDYVVNWENKGSSIKSYKKNGVKKSASVRNEKFYFKLGITWSSVTSGTFSARILNVGHLFDSGGSAIFPYKEDNERVLALLNSKIMDYVLSVQNPTLNFQPGDIGSIPIIELPNKKVVSSLSKKNIYLCKIDWNSCEVSRDFKVHPLV